MVGGNYKKIILVVLLNVYLVNWAVAVSIYFVELYSIILLYWSVNPDDIVSYF